jgi:CHAT domain-containing protein
MRFLLLLACWWLLLPGLASGDPVDLPGLDAAQKRLLAKELFSEDDIGDLISLNEAVAQGYKLDPELAFPQPWDDLLIASFYRVHSALLLENYQALLDECQRRHWLRRLAVEMHKLHPPKDKQEEDFVSTVQDGSLHQTLEAFARRKLRILNPDELPSLGGRYVKAGERAILDLLAARVYLDQGQMAAYQKSLDRFAFVEAEVSQPLVRAFRCLRRHDPRYRLSLEQCVAQVLAAGVAYRPGEKAAADISWIVAGDEMAGLAGDLLGSLKEEDDPALQQTIEQQTAALETTLTSWRDQALGQVEGGNPFALDEDMVTDLELFERRRGLLAVILGCEKALLALGIEEVQTSEQLGAMRQQLQGYRRSAHGFWLEMPDRFFPTRGDFYEGSILHRRDVELQVEQSKLAALPAASVAELIAVVLALSPQETALALALSWAEDLQRSDAAAAEQLLSGAHALATEFRLPGWRLALARERVKLLQGQGRKEEALRLADDAIAAAKDLVTPTAPAPGGKTTGELVNELSDLIAEHWLESGDPVAALAQLDEGQALKSAYQLSKDAARSDGAAGQAMQAVQGAQADQDRKAREEALGTAGVVASGQDQILASARELQARHAELFDRTLSIKPLELPGLQKLLPEDVLLLQYFPTETTLYIFAVTSRTLELKSVPLPKEALDAQLLSYLRAMRRVDSKPAFSHAATTLYSQLLEPVAETLASHETILLVPTGRLNYLPFASLINPQGQPLAASHKIAILSRSSDLMNVLAGQGGRRLPGHAANSDQAKDSMLVLADPAGDLPAARREGEALAAMYPGGVSLFQERATQQALQAGLAGGSLLHLATHGEVDPDDPSRSYLVLAQGQRLNAETIFALPIQGVRMVTLSACNTAIGATEPAASVVSLAESFWVTGPGCVVATLWAVNDESTAQFMVELYEAMLAGAGPAEAIRKAQLALRQVPEFSHPYFWSPFVLLGDWR